MRPARSVCLTLVLTICTGWLSTTFAQFSGSAGIGFATYRNAEGTDTSSADLAITPDLQLDYTFKFSPIASLKSGISFQYDLYLEKPERSYFTISPELVYKVYLSNQDAIREESAKVAAISAADPTYQLIAADLTALSDSTLNLRTAVERTALKADAIADIQSDVAATLLAYVALLEEMGLSQSFKEVLIEELGTIKERVALLGVPKHELSRYNAKLDAVTAFLTKTTAESDFTLSPSAGSEESSATEAEEMDTETEASLITLIGSGLEHFSSSRFYPKYYQGAVYATTYASKLSATLSVARKQYGSTYESYTYTALRLQPHLDIYPSSTVGIGFNYLFDRTTFPQSDLYTFTENALRVDSRIELSSGFCLVAELGLGRRSYPNPMSITAGPPGPRTTYTAPNNYLRLSPGIGIIAFPLEKLSLGVAMRITRNPSEDAIYLGGVTVRRVTNSSYFGLASDESYIYEATTISGAATMLLPANIELGVDIVSEHRAYPPPPTIRNVRATTRSDDAMWLGGSLSKYIIPDRDVLGFIESLYPRLSITYTDLASNLDEFSYSDLSIAASISLGF